MERTPAALAKMIDHTLLKPNITNEEMKQACDVARAYGFKSVAMNAAMIQVRRFPPRMGSSSMKLDIFG